MNLRQIFSRRLSGERSTSPQPDPGPALCGWMLGLPRVRARSGILNLVGGRTIHLDDANLARVHDALDGTLPLSELNEREQADFLILKAALGSAGSPQRPQGPSVD